MPPKAKGKGKDGPAKFADKENLARAETEVLSLQRLLELRSYEVQQACMCSSIVAVRGLTPSFLNPPFLFFPIPIMITMQPIHFILRYYLFPRFCFKCPFLGLGGPTVRAVVERAQRGLLVVARAAARGHARHHQRHGQAVQGHAGDRLKADSRPRGAE